MVEVEGVVTGCLSVDSIIYRRGIPGTCHAPRVNLIKNLHVAFSLFRVFFNMAQSRVSANLILEMVKDTSVFNSGRSNFAALMSSDDEDSVPQTTKMDQTQAETTNVETVEAVGTEEDTGHEEEEDEWCPVVTAKQKKTTTHPKEGVSSNPGTGKGARHPSFGHHKSHGTVVIGNGQAKKSTSALPPLTLAEISRPETTLELYGFPAKYRTGHLRKFVESVVGEGAGYRLKWQNDSSCWVVFDQPESRKL